MIFDMLEYHRMIDEKNISLIYGGEVWDDSIEVIAATLRNRMESDGVSAGVASSVFSIFVELLNNVLMYSACREPHESLDSDDTSAASGAFLLGVRDKTYFVQSGNVMKSESVKLVKSRIDHLNSLDKDEIRNFYREKIKSKDTNPESRGGGVGLIEIARRASSKIEYSFKPYNEGLTFFEMLVAIDLKEK